MTGATGATGGTGPTGITGLAQYGYVYNLAPETVAVEEDVHFDHDGVLSPGILHPVGSAEITLTEAGVYQVTFSVSGTEQNQVALFVNGVVVAGTIYGSGSGTQQNTGQALINIAAGDVLTVRNHTSPAAFDLSSPIGGTQPNTNASVLIEKLA